MKIKNNIYSLFQKVFLFLFLIIFCGTILDNKSIYVVDSPLYILIGFLIVSALFLGIYNIILKKTNKELPIKKEIIIVGSLFFLLLLLQLIYGYIMAAYPGWDWHDVMSAAMQYVEGKKSAINWEYFQMYPNNNTMLYIEIVLFKMLKVLGLYSYRKGVILTIGINILMIDLSVFFLYLTVRELFGKPKAIFSIILCMLCYAFYCYIPVFYTDTVTMLFPILMIYLYVKYNKNKNYRLLIFLTVVSLIGYKIKPTCIIPFIAIIIDMFFRNELKKSYKGFAYLFVSLIITYSLISFLEVKLSVFPYDIKNNTNEIPYTHWIMMGMTERDSYQEGRKYIGWYNPDSMEITLSHKTTEERKQANIKQIKKQYKQYGLIEYIKFLYRKMLYVWSDGTYYAPTLATPQPNKNENNPLRKFTTLEGDYYKITFWQNIGMFLFIYFFMIIGIQKYIRKNDNKFNYAYLTIFGILLFLLIWEASSRYLLTFTPVLLLCTMNGFKEERIKKKKSIKKLIENSITKLKERRLNMTKKMNNLISKLNKLVTKKNVLIGLIILTILFLIPIILTAFYAVPSADDFSYGKFTMNVLSQKGILGLLGGVIKTVKYYYVKWQGTYSAIALFSLNPGVLGHQYYFLTTFIILGAYFAGLAYLLKQVIIRFLKLDRSTYWIVLILFFLLSIETMVDKTQGLYWWNGSCYYILFFTFELLEISLLIKQYVLKEKTKKNTIILYILIGIIGGGNFIVALQQVILLFFLNVYLIIGKKDKSAIPYLLVSIVSLGISGMAPGNNRRKKYITGMNPVMAILLSFVYCLQFMTQWTTPLMMMVLIIIALMLYPSYQKIEKKFPKPILLIGWMYCIISAEFTPTLYSLSVPGEGRLLNIIYFSYLFFIVISIYYLIGHFRNILINNKVLSKNETSKLKNYFNQNAFVILATILVIVFGAIYFQRKSLTSYETLALLRSGMGKVYREEWDNRFKVLEDDSIKEVEFQPLTYRPYPLFVRDFNADSNEWPNDAARILYNKKVLVVIEEDHHEEDQE